MKYTVSCEISLLEALEKLSPDSSKTTLRSWLKEGRVYVDEAEAKLSNQLLNKGQVVTVTARKKPVEGNLSIIYEDKYLVAIDKPHGMLSVAAAFDKGNTAHAFLKARYKPNKVYVVHRIDQDTSGVMIFALTEKAYEELKKIFEAHDLDRSYTAIVEGRLDRDAGSWESYLYEDANYVVHTTEDKEKGRLSITHYSVENISGKFSRLRLQLETGRKNQIRVQCQEAGHSVVGDKKYGARSNPLHRLCLHASTLAFEHPITKKKIRLESPVPALFDRLVPPRKSN